MYEAAPSVITRYHSGHLNSVMLVRGGRPELISVAAVAGDMKRRRKNVDLIEMNILESRFFKFKIF